MREIKFRAWNSHSKKMEYMEPYHGLYTISFMEYMQYTGSTDVNGKEIYEGDILEYESGYRGCVLYEIGCFWVASSRRDDHLYVPPAIVVGNIYENPELLQKEDLRILGIEAQVYGK